MTVVIVIINIIAIANIVITDIKLQDSNSNISTKIDSIIMAMIDMIVTNKMYKQLICKFFIGCCLGNAFNIDIESPAVKITARIIVHLPYSIVFKNSAIDNGVNILIILININIVPVVKISANFRLITL